MSAEHAVDDFIGKLEAIGSATGGNAGNRPTLVSIILDGENCWEYYPDSGVDFSAHVVSPRGRSIRRSRRPRSAITCEGIRPPTRSARSLPAVGFSTISASGSAIPSAIELGTCCSKRGSTSSLPAQEPEAENGRSIGASLARAVHRRRERLVLVVRRQPPSAPARLVRPPVPQAFAKRLHDSRRSRFRPNLLRPIRGNAAAAADVQRADEPVERKDRRPAQLLRMAQRGLLCSDSRARGDERRHGNALRRIPFRIRRRHLYLRLDARGGPVREQWTDIDSLRVVFASHRDSSF